MDPRIVAGLSGELAGLAAAASAKVFHVPSAAGGRSALGFDGRRLLVPALMAEAEEELELLAPGGAPVRARVKGFDPSRGLAVLELAEALPATAFAASPRGPALGSLVLALAFPSPEGPEARIEAIRFAGAAGDGVSDYIQTDGPAYPGFSGGALVSPDGSLAGFIAADRPGNRGWAIPAARAAALIVEIADKGFPGRAYLGLSTLPTAAPASLAALFGDGREEALLVADAEAEGPAAKAGVQPGDFLVSIGGRPVGNPEELREALDAATPGLALPLVLIRGGARLELSVTPAERRDEGPRARRWPGHGRGRGWHCSPGR